MNDLLYSLFNGIDAPEIREVNAPLDIWKNENGDYFIELAIPGKHREDVKLSYEKTETGPALRIKVEPDKANQERIRHSVKKIKRGAIDLLILVPDGVNISALTASVRDGLFHIEIPAAEEAKPIEFTID